jgi:hypothetical protein
MARYAMIVTATGVVDNVIVYDGVSPFTPPTGIELRVATDNAEPGGTWNGSEFVRAIRPGPTRTQVLMREVKNLEKWDEETEEMVDKTAEEIAAEKLELKNLLTASLVGGEDLNWERTQTLLRLEREDG